ncbi:MAG: PASTA domain-containing protein [bacterium TMED144]|nr:MAG: PASTA domain-containing protein [bacterium TMED144]|tara:strand:- start:50 stop:811 length:762 start_codon:yes stop_codon:yes gene_type:complete
MKHRILNFLTALFITSFLIFLFFEKIAMPIYIRKGNSIRLINVRGKVLDRGINELKISGFNGVVFDTVYTSNIEPQTIIDQYPPSGQKVKKGRTIRLKIARPEKMIDVPSLVGQSKRSAEIKIQQLGLKIDTIYVEYNPDYPKGTVAWQFPKSGDQIRKGFGLQITISEGLPPDFYQVPQLFGLSLNNAKKKLDSSRLKLGKVTYQQNEDLVPYTVLDQSISPGTVLSKSSQINIIVSVLNLQDIFDSIQNQK